MTFKSFFGAVYATFVLAGTTAAATLELDFTRGITEGHNQNRATVVGTVDVNVDSRRARDAFDFGLLRLGEVVGIYGRVVSASDFFAFRIARGTRFEISLDLDGYHAYRATVPGSSTLRPEADFDFVTTAGLINQSLLGPDPKLGRPKPVVFRLTAEGGKTETVPMTTNTYGVGAESRLFSGALPTRYVLEVDGKNNTPALYDIAISVVQVPTHGSLLFALSGLALFATAQRKQSRSRRFATRS